MKPFMHALLAGGSMLLTASLAQAEVVSFQDGVDGYSGTEDTFVRSYQVNGNFESTVTMHVGGGINRALLRFDVSSLAADEREVDSITLTLTTGGTINAGREMAIYAMHSDDGDWTASNTTWNEKDKGVTAWVGGEGGGKAGTGDTILLATFNVPETTETAFDVTLPASIVEQWIAGENHGLLIRDAADEDADVTYIRSSDTPNVSQRPKLTVTLVPEPASASLIGLTSMLALSRSLGRPRGN